MKLFLLVFMFAIHGLSTECARILGMFALFAKSHHRFFQPIMKTLAQAGHEVVVYSPFPLHNPPPNYTDVYLENIPVDSTTRKEFFKKIATFPYYMSVDCSWQYNVDLYYEWIGDKEVKKLLTSGDHFDLIMVETIGQDFSLILGHIFHAPVISLQAYYMDTLAKSYAGNSLSNTFIPDLGSPFSDRMSFYQRLYNSLSTWRTLFLYYNVQLPKIETAMRKMFPDMPTLVEMTTNIALIFTNDHLTADYAQPRTPNMIPVAGIHIEPSQPLPEEIKRFMDEATDGVVFFSLGTYVQDEIQPEEYFDMYNNVFRRLKQRVLWKTRRETIQGLPANVMTLKWAAQEAILAHPNCVLFITHGGLFSQHETVHYGVPVVGIPQFFDQYRNVKFYEARGVGFLVDSKDISELSISAAIHEVIYNHSYRENMKRLSTIFRDRPLSPAESVVFWTEYVLRHGGAAHLRPASTELRWYQIILLDVISLVTVILVILFVTIFLILKRLSTCISRQKFFMSLSEHSVSTPKKIN